MPRQRSSASKVVSPDRLKKLLGTARKNRSEIVFTNGCFDLLHRGHVSYLERARALGDLLVVALNSDASVKRLKGPERPLNKLEDRLLVMAALGCVDYVTWFGEDTPLALIQKLRPTVLVKGGDWKPESIVGAEDVLSWGGKVRSLRFVQGRSTTRTIQKIKKTS